MPKRCYQVTDANAQPVIVHSCRECGPESFCKYAPDRDRAVNGTPDLAAAAIGVTSPTGDRELTITGAGRIDLQMNHTEGATLNGKAVAAALEGVDPKYATEHLRYLRQVVTKMAHELDVAPAGNIQARGEIPAVVKLYGEMGYVYDGVMMLDALVDAVNDLTAYTKRNEESHSTASDRINAVQQRIDRVAERLTQRVDDACKMADRAPERAAQLLTTEAATRIGNEVGGSLSQMVKLMVREEVARILEEADADDAANGKVERDDDFTVGGAQSRTVVGGSIVRSLEVDPETRQKVAALIAWEIARMPGVDSIDARKKIDKARTKDRVAALEDGWRLQVQINKKLSTKLRDLDKAVADLALTARGIPVDDHSYVIEDSGESPAAEGTGDDFDELAATVVATPDGREQLAGMLRGVFKADAFERAAAPVDTSKLCACVLYDAGKIGAGELIQGCAICGASAQCPLTDDQRQQHADALAATND